MRTINIHEAKTHLSRLVEEAVNGEPFIIAKAGKPRVKVVPIDTKAGKKGKRRLGVLEGLYEVPNDFDTMLSDEIEKLFAGKK
ncbi:MAG: type II toxin-antitoxin system prevent-host-death family antitoxin [Acidobacteriaceae bacterium]|nr:type II toxin-antitoxin system prevent-host-death family antitoxin [Acidobacteriaceae bacterium]